MKDINDYFAAFIKLRKKETGLFHKEICYAAKMERSSYIKFLGRKYKHGVKRGIKLSTADRLLSAVGSSWADYATWLKTQ